jgi:hypothetical protein
MMDGLAFLPVLDLTNGIHLLRTLCPDDPPEAAELSTDSSFFLLTPLDDTPYRRMSMSYQVEEIVVPALAHVVGSGITVDCGIMYVPRHVQLQERLQNLCRDLTTGQKTIAEYLCGVGWNIRLNHQY